MEYLFGFIKVSIIFFTMLIMLMGKCGVIANKELDIQKEEIKTFDLKLEYLTDLPFDVDIRVTQGKNEISTANSLVLKYPIKENQQDVLIEVYAPDRNNRFTASTCFDSLYRYSEILNYKNQLLMLDLTPCKRTTALEVKN